MQMP